VDQVGGGILRGAGASTGDVVLAGCGVVRCREVWCWRYRRTVDQVGGGILRGAGASTGDVVLAGCVVWPWRRDQRSAREETIC